MGKFDIIADLALEAHVGDEAEIRFRVDARRVPCIGVAIGIAAGDVEEQHEIVAIGDMQSSGALLGGRAGFSRI